METSKKTTSFIFSFCIFCLALAIAYLAYELYRFRTDFPDILVQMEHTAEVIHPTVSGIAEISRHIPPIADEIEQVRQITPSILEEVEHTRQSLPDILDRISAIVEQTDEIRKVMPDMLTEIRQTREMVPSVLERIDAVEKQLPPLREEISAIRQDLPQILETIDNASTTLRSFSTEMAKIRKASPEALDEIAKTRQALPEMLDQTERIVTQAQQTVAQAEQIVTQGQRFGSEASKGAVEGLLMGILNPLNISSRLKDLVLPGSESVDLSDADIALLREAAIQVVETGIVGEEMAWENPASQNRGNITLTREYTEKDADCYEIRAEIWGKKDKTHDFNIVLCRQPDGTWREKKNPLSSRKDDRWERDGK